MPRRMVYVTGMPRSGSTWVSQLLAAHPAVRVKFCPLFSYEFRGRCAADSTAEQWRAMFDDVYRTPGRFLDQVHLREHGYVPDFELRLEQPPVLAIKSNRFHDLTPSMVEKLPEITWIALARDPIASIASWVQNPTEFIAPCSVEADWRSGACRKTRPGEYWGFEDWLKVARLHKQLSAAFAERFHLLHYEDLAPDPLAAAEKILACARLEVHEQVLEFAGASQRAHSPSQRSVFKDPKRSKSNRAALSERIVECMLEETRAAGLEQFLRPAQLV